MYEEIIEKFKNREVKAKSIFKVKEISKNRAYDFVRQYHYLGDARFFSMYAYGLFINMKLVGVATYSTPQGNNTLMGWFGLGNDDKSVLELSRLCMLPILNGTNATSFLLGNSMKIMHKDHSIRAVITLADSSRHIGSIYQVCNFKYYGLTDQKAEFFCYDWGGKVKCRGEKHDYQGCWLNTSRKHRYAYIMDKNLNILYDEQPHPTQKGTLPVECCKGTKIVYDKRYDVYYTCPKCCGYMKKLIKDGDTFIEEEDKVKEKINPLKLALMKRNEQ
ncbi:MAG: hypothetical protein MJZ34_07125 [Paludibacteraceae bacterium]|nr:hypothetical protein [Paludibacteraceae bacterium]